MPIYEYQCEDCGRRSEVMQRVSDPPLETCEDCSGTLRKLLSAPAFQFKGSGWYVTDYARKSGGESKESQGSKDAGKESSTKSDAGEKSTSSSSKSETKKGSGD